jgi:hypothetical protein
MITAALACSSGGITAIPASDCASARRATERPSMASNGVMVRPIAVTICQKAAVSGRINWAAAAADRTMRVVSDGEAMMKPASAATPLRAPLRRSSSPVTSALTSSTPTTASRTSPQLATMSRRSTLIPTVIRKIPSARPRKGAVITSTSL